MTTSLDPTTRAKLANLAKRADRLAADCRALLRSAEGAADAAEMVRAKRTELGISQAELGRRLGLSTTTVYRYEAGTIIPPADVLARLDALS